MLEARTTASAPSSPDVRAVACRPRERRFPKYQVRLRLGFGNSERDPSATPKGLFTRSAPGSTRTAGPGPSFENDGLSASAIMLCASAAHGSACFGDSGSGLVTEGPASGSRRCPRASSRPGVRRRVRRRSTPASELAGLLRFLHRDRHPPRAPRFDFSSPGCAYSSSADRVLVVGTAPRCTGAARGCPGFRTAISS